MKEVAVHQPQENRLAPAFLRFIANAHSVALDATCVEQMRLQPFALEPESRP